MPVLSSGSGKIIMEIGREDFEEIVIEGETELVKTLCVDAFACKDIVDVGAVAIELASEPRDGASSLFESLLNNAAYVYHNKGCKANCPIPI